MNTARTDLRANGDVELAGRILAEPGVAEAVERHEKAADLSGARRHLLATALRLTPEMAPDVRRILDDCCLALGIDQPIESYVYPEQHFNAATLRPERGRLLIMVSAGLLEAFEPEELRFVIGHELGHYLFEHHRIPVNALLDRQLGGPGLALRLFAWQRYAEISSDRAGLLSAGGLDPAANALFKLASGLRGNRIEVRVDQFLAQVGELREESDRLARAEEPVRSDWFATHPFSPLRVRAAELFAGSELITPGGMSRDDMEARVDELVRVMDPSYLQEPSEAAEAMRRLLFAGAVLIASVDGEVAPAAMRELEALLGPGSVPTHVDPEVIRRDLPSRIEQVRKTVPPLRRAQVIRDLCLIVQADGRVTDREMRIVLDLADSVGVDHSMVSCTPDARGAGPGKRGRAAEA